MKTLLAVFGTIVVLLVFALLLVWSGVYNIAANKHHWGLTSELIEELRDRSIIAHSKNIASPSLKDPKLSDDGAPHYHHACRFCHGAPGQPPMEFAKGLYPRPPRLTDKDVQGWKDGELFWIVKSGLKMTGMPAFGVTHTDEELWETVAFLRILPRLKAEDYKSMTKSEMPMHGDEASHD